LDRLKCLLHKWSFTEHMHVKYDHLIAIQCLARGPYCSRIYYIHIYTHSPCIYTIHVRRQLMDRGDIIVSRWRRVVRAWLYLHPSVEELWQRFSWKLICGCWRLQRGLRPRRGGGPRALDRRRGRLLALAAPPPEEVPLPIGLGIGFEL
jgi:hypothetical protein